MAALSKFTPEVVVAILDAKRRGLTDRAAAKESSISDRSLRAWLSAGRSGVEPFAVFAAGYDAAVSHYRRERVKQILRAAGVL